MVDGIKFRIDPECVRDSDVLEFHRINDKQARAEYRGMRIELHPDSCFVRGSIHKYKNGGKHNADDFKLSEFIQALNDLSATLGFNAASTQFYAMEFGVNIELPFEASRFINSVVWAGKGKVANSDTSLTIEFSEYEIKIYLKEIKTQPRTNNSLLRYEIRITKTRRLKQIAEGVYCSTLQDLTNPDVWRLLGDELLNVYDSLLIVDRDTIDVSKINPDDAKLYVNGVSPGYWLRNDFGHKEKKRRIIKKFKDLVNTHSESTLKNDVRALLETKINSLIDIETNVTFSPNKIVETPQKDVTFSPNKKENRNVKECEKCDVFPTWITCENVTFLKPNLHFCEVTNLSLDIGIKQGSYLSSKGVEFYYYKHPEIYKEKLETRLSKKWKNAPLKIQFREIAHSIRNEKYNPRNNPRNNSLNSIRNVLGKGSLLFSLAETIRPDKREYLDFAITKYSKCHNKI
jgi:hypothetical protein